MTRSPAAPCKAGCSGAARTNDSVTTSNRLGRLIYKLLPPVALRTWPVAHRPCSEARHAMTAAMSSGQPMRLSTTPETTPSPAVKQVYKIFTTRVHALAGAPAFAMVSEFHESPTTVPKHPDPTGSGCFCLYRAFSAPTAASPPLRAEVLQDHQVHDPAVDAALLASELLPSRHGP